MPQKKYIKPEAVARMLDISTRTLEGWRRKNLGPPWKNLGHNLIRYDWADLEQWISTRHAENKKRRGR